MNLVILTQPPHFRPPHLKAAVEAGKHVFMEKPVAVDPVGVRSVIQSSELADKKSLTILAGTQMRRISHAVEAAKRVHDGAIGEILGGQCVRLGDAMRSWGPQQREAGWSDMEWQLRRWLFMTWLSGDFIVEMHVHNLDMMNWLIGCPSGAVHGHRRPAAANRARVRRLATTTSRSSTSTRTGCASSTWVRRSTR